MIRFLVSWPARPGRGRPGPGMPLGLVLASVLATGCASAPVERSAAGEDENVWVERTLAGLDLSHKVGQMIVPRVSGAFMTIGGEEYERVRDWIEDLGVGGLIETLGPPLEATLKFNELQRLAEIPLLITADMENGPGQLLNGGTVLPYGLENGGGTRFPPLMGLGATGEERLARELGRITAIEGRAAGVHLNFAPVVDVNNNPANPIINTRSFGSDPSAVSRMAAAMIRGMQENGMLAAAKHFPGHGDTDTDSHLALPLIAATREHVDSVELPPYRAAIDAGVAAIMSAHIAFPALTHDSVPATLNPALLTGLLRRTLGFRGLIVTDALDMGAIVDGWGVVEAPVRAVEAGADLLLQIPADDVAAAIAGIVGAVRSGRITESRIDRSVRRILAAKAGLGLDRERFVDPARVSRVVGAPSHRAIAMEAAEKSITLVRDRLGVLPLHGRVLVVIYHEAVEPFAGRTFTTTLGESLEDVRSVGITATSSPAELQDVRTQADSADVVVFAPFVRVGAFLGTIAVSDSAAAALIGIAQAKPVVTVSFGSPYLLSQMPQTGTYVLAWGQWDEPQRAAAHALTGRSRIGGRLPIPLPPAHKLGAGIIMEPVALERPGADPTRRSVFARLSDSKAPNDAGMDSHLPATIDSIVATALADGAAPGAAVAVGRHGRIVHLAGYGRVDVAPDSPPVTDSTIYDLASLTKVVGTTTAIMILVDEKRLDLDSRVGEILPEWTGDRVKSAVTVRNLLLHDSGLPAFAPLWTEYRGPEAFLKRIAATPLEYAPGSKTVYSDFGAILLGFIVERRSGQPLDTFLEERVFGPLGLHETGFNPLRWSDVAVAGRIAPTEMDTVFRMRQVRGRVHDENAFAMGGVAGHAGLFSSARDLAIVAQMLLDRGEAQGHRIVADATVRAFTHRASPASTRALGWDTPGENSSAGDWFSGASFGHTGFTGTSIWMDPEHDVFLVLLTNRVDPTRENQRHVRLRRDLADAVQQAIRDQPVARR
jgi:beta-N-acetylhexosaminidase